MRKMICKVGGCGARAWHGDLCNLHALEQLRSRPRQPLARRLEHGKRLLREKARELGIELAEGEVVTVEAGRARKVRSPVT